MCYKSTGSPALFSPPTTLGSLRSPIFFFAPLHLGNRSCLSVFISVYHSFPPEPPLYPPHVYTTLLSVCDEFNNPMTTTNCVYRYLEMASVFSSVINSSPKLPWGCGEFDKLYENVVPKVHFHYFLASLKLLYRKQLALRSQAHHKIEG